MENKGLSKELIDEYNSFIYKTKIYPKELPIIYPVLGMCGESGEAAEKVKKVLRDNNKEFSEENQSIKGSLKGIGTQIGLRDGQLVIIAPLEDSPAERAGLQADDYILEINGESTKGINIEAAADNPVAYL